MKKIAILAALLASIGLAQAQSSVTLYGTLDAGVQQIGKADGSKNVTAFADSALTSSIWGLRGSEDLGGGTKATFNVEGDIQTNNGQSNTAGLFRRAANVGLGGRYGQIDLGLKLNPLFAAGQNTLPMNSNSVGLSTAVAMGFSSSFFTKNAVTYTTPEYAGWKAQAQWGAGNTVDQVQDGTVQSAAIMGKVVGADVRGAVMVRNAGGAASSANGTAGNQTVYVVGGKYPIGKFALGADFISVDTAGAKLNATAYGVSYQATPTVSVGANYVVNTGGSKLYNAQARYAFSKRTVAYAQVGVADNGASGAFRPVFVSNSDNITGYAGTANTTQTAYGVGIIHSF